MMKALQPGRGYPDLFIRTETKPENGSYHGLFIELKPEGSKDIQEGRHTGNNRTWPNNLNAYKRNPSPGSLRNRV